MLEDPYHFPMNGEAADEPVDIWIERYRPRKLDEIKGHDDIVRRLKGYVEQDDLPNLIFAGPAGTGKTAAAQCIARELYGEEWGQHLLELNASDNRGIDVVRERIKNFAGSSFGGQNYEIVFLDEADSLTDDSQQALRRTIEQFSHSTRFILSCNYVNQIIGPIKSRCTLFQFSPLSDAVVAERIQEIADLEGISLTDDGMDALVYVADGDMRRAINILQSLSDMDSTIDDETVFTHTTMPRPEEMEAILEHAIQDEFTEAYSLLDELLSERGVPANDLIDRMHRVIRRVDLPDDVATEVIDRVGEVDFRLTRGADERIQFEALLAAISLKTNGDLRE